VSIKRSGKTDLNGRLEEAKVFDDGSMVARFSLVQHTKTGKNIPNKHKHNKWPQNIPNGRKTDQMDVKYNNIFQC
jgi:hypothetical protein